MALSDLRVLDLSRLLPGPFCTLLLADLGADVIKVEDPGPGDYLRQWPPLHDGAGVMFAALNRNKRSLVLDLKTPAGIEALLRLVESSDVVVESFRPGVMHRLGVGYAAMRERNRRIVVASISGYGQSGPYRDRAGHDLNYIGLAGVLAADDPQVPTVQMGDVGGGALMAAVGILAAVHEAQRSGEGQLIDVAMLDGLLAWQTGAIARTLAEAHAGEGDILTGAYPCYSIYACRDGHLTVAALEPKFWHALVEVLGVAHLRDDAFSEGDRGTAVVAELAAIFAASTRAEWRDRLSAHDVCVEPVNSVADVIDDVHVRDRGLLLGGATTGGLAQMGFPLRLTRTPATFRTPAPAQGEQSRQILQEAGYDDAAIDTLFSEGVTR